jgi:ribosomal protein S12 methylthiotransferase accessory factor
LIRISSRIALQETANEEGREVAEDADQGPQAAEARLYQGRSNEEEDDVSSVSPSTQRPKLDLGGTWRSCSPAKTLAWVRPLFPQFGITRVANVTGLDHIGIPVWMCIRPNARSLSVSQGKGLTHELAQASAVMESIELHHGEHAAAPDMVASYRTLCRRHQVVNPRTIEPGVRGDAYDSGRPIAWIRGTDLPSGAPVFVPHARIDMSSSRAHPDDGLFLVTSTGLASGNQRAEALCHAIFEVIERDCEWRWDRLSEDEQAAREIDGRSLRSPVLRGLLRKFAAADVSVRIWDIASPVGMPAYACTIAQREPMGAIGRFAGSGCHLSPDVALSRALTEAAQSRLTFIAGSRDDLFPSAYDSVKGTAAYAHEARGATNMEADSRRGPLSTFEEDLRETLNRLSAAGYSRVVAVEHTRPEYGIPVVAVVIPGMHEGS